MGRKGGDQSGSLDEAEVAAEAEGGARSLDTSVLWGNRKLFWFSLERAPPATSHFFLSFTY